MANKNVVFPTFFANCRATAYTKIYKIQLFRENANIFAYGQEEQLNTVKIKKQIFKNKYNK